MHNLSTDDLMRVSDQPAPRAPGRDAQYLSTEGVLDTRTRNLVHVCRRGGILVCTLAVGVP